MKRLCLCVLGVLLFAAPDAVTAQQLPSTVQLPTYSFFGVGTSVSVPDRGSAYLGGVTRASSGVSEFGVPLTPFRNRSFGSERSVANMSVSVYIHDFEAMEETILRQAAGATLQPRWPVAADVVRWDSRPDGAPSPAGSVADIRRHRAQEQLAREEEAVSFFERGRTAEEAGKANVAKIYYQMAARRASGALKQQITARLAAVSPAKQAPKLAQGAP